jgi:hypothetical protein
VIIDEGNKGGPKKFSVPRSLRKWINLPLLEFEKGEFCNKLLDCVLTATYEGVTS